VADKPNEPAEYFVHQISEHFPMERGPHPHMRPQSTVIAPLLAATFGGYHFLNQQKINVLLFAFAV
jgi:hypothetical protein